MDQPPARQAIGFHAFTGEAATIGIFVILLAMALQSAAYFFAPLLSALVLGLLLSPLAVRLERRGLPASLVAVILLVAALAALGIALFGLVLPLGLWIDRAPLLWYELRELARSVEEPLRNVTEMRDEIRDLLGSGDAVLVAREEGDAVGGVVATAPSVAGQALIFIGALYFYLAGRRELRGAFIGLYRRRADQLRIARLLAAIEYNIAHYLAAIALINLVFGTVVAGAMALVGLPQPWLLGMMAFALNFIPYLGPAIMAALVFTVGLLTFGDLVSPFYVAALYLFLNMIEGQFVTPGVIGRSETLNPFLVFCSIAFGLWFWGAVGAFLAVPVLLVLRTVAVHSRPSRGFMRPRYALRRAS